jgi:hypothetical protein
MSNGNDTASDKALDLYKLEYEQAAARYQSIYQSAWSNFSYLTAVAAGIIAFGSKGMPAYLTIVLATLPLFFWYFAVFRPANTYGDQVICRLSEIEKFLSEKHKINLRHFSIFHGRGGGWLRVRNIVTAAALLLLALDVWLVFWKPSLKGATEPESVNISQPANKPLAVQVVGADTVQKLSQENEQLRGALDEMKRSLDSISTDLKVIKERQK